MTNHDANAFATQYGGGLTKREYFAAAAMQGILANKAMVKKINDYADTQDEDINELLGEVATEFADGLIEALNKASND